MKTIIINDMQFKSLLSEMVHQKPKYITRLRREFSAPLCLLEYSTKEFKEKLYEELGINDGVTEYALQLSQLLVQEYNSIQDKQKAVKYDSIGREYIEIQGEFEFCKKLTQMDFVIINFDNWKDLQQNVSRYNIGASFNGDMQGYELYVPAVNWELDEKLIYPFLTHEMMHNFQQYKMSRKDLFTSSDRALYNKAFQNATNPLSNEVEKACGEILYLSNIREISAYINQLYADLINNPQFTKESNTKNKIRIATLTETFEIRKYWRYCLDMLTEYLSNLEIAQMTKKTYNLSPMQILKIGEKYYKRFENGIHKAILKAINNI